MPRFDALARSIQIVVTILVLAIGAERSYARNCNFNEGEDRWTIKTSVKTGALDGQVKDVSLESLIDSPNPQLSTAQKTAIANKLWAGRLSVADNSGGDLVLREGDMISVEGFLYRARCQRDGDYHLEIGISDKKGAHCLIVEAPDPDEAKDADLKAKLTAVRRALDTADPGIFTGNATPISVKVTGQFFLDAHHITKGDPGGGRGTKKCATNVLEIHPVTALEIR